MLTRYAPSPTGHLHLGHVVNAIYVWGLARAAGGRVLLRMEDHDRVRCRPEFESSILEDLDWLGFVPDDGLHPILRQSERDDVYRSALEQLRRTHHVYACACSRKQISGERYEGFCRERGLADAPGRGLRVRIDEGVETFDDLLLGGIKQDPAHQCGDLLLRDRDGNWTYQFAVTVDDMLQGITDIIRGEDLASSTGRQLRLRQMLGGTGRPRFAHHRLILKPGGEKLSKAAADTGVRELRQSGMTPEDIIGTAVVSVGLTDEFMPVAADRVTDFFRDSPRAARIHRASSQ